MVKFEASGGVNCKFYFWLNVSSILYNEELKVVTAARDAARERMNSEIDTNNKLKRHAKTMNITLEEARADYEAPIHFDEIELVQEEKLKTEQDRTLLMYPRDKATILRNSSLEEKKKEIEEEKADERSRLAMVMTENLHNQFESTEDLYDHLQ